MMSEFLDKYLKFVNLQCRGVTELPINLGSWKSEIRQNPMPLDPFTHLFEACLTFTTGCQIQLDGRNDDELIIQTFKRIRRAISYEIYGDYKKKLYELSFALERRDFVEAMDKLQELLREV